MIVVICTLSSVGKLWEAFVYRWNDDFQQILSFIKTEGLTD